MAFDAFIKVDGIPGEALDENYREWIEVTGYNFGAHQSTSATASSAGGASSGRTTMTTFTFTKTIPNTPRFDRRLDLGPLDAYLFLDSLCGPRLYR